jgi:hypothetical protein
VCFERNQSKLKVSERQWNKSSEKKMKMMFALLVIACVQLAVNSHPIEEQLNVSDVSIDDILKNIPEDVKMDEINDLLRRIVDIIMNDVRMSEARSSKWWERKILRAFEYEAAIFVQTNWKIAIFISIAEQHHRRSNRVPSRLQSRERNVQTHHVSDERNTIQRWD